MCVLLADEAFVVMFLLTDTFFFFFFNSRAMKNLAASPWMAPAWNKHPSDCSFPGQLSRCNRHMLFNAVSVASSAAFLLLYAELRTCQAELCVATETSAAPSHNIPPWMKSRSASTRPFVPAVRHAAGWGADPSAVRARSIRPRRTVVLLFQGLFGQDEGRSDRFQDAGDKWLRKVWTTSRECFQKLLSAVDCFLTSEVVRYSTSPSGRWGAPKHPPKPPQPHSRRTLLSNTSKSAYVLFTHVAALLLLLLLQETMGVGGLLSRVSSTCMARQWIHSIWSFHFHRGLLL